MQSEAPLTMILSPLRAGRGEQERIFLGSLFGEPDTVPPKVPLSLSGMCLPWVAQATRLFRRATRPTARRVASRGTMEYSRVLASRTRLPAGRREGRAGRRRVARTTLGKQIPAG